MGKYQDDMSKEKRPTGLIPQGKREVIVTSMELGTSKAGNPQFITSIEDVLTSISMNLYLVNVSGKRWTLKSLLDSVEVPKNSEGEHNWSEEDVIGKKVIAIVEHYSEPWINKDGVEVMSNKAKVREFQKLSNNNESWSE